MKSSSNQDNIDAWETYPQQKIVEFGDEGDFGRQQLLNPHLLRLMDNVLDKLLLDAGCGNGYLCRKLAKRGAIVTGLEPAKIFYDFAQQLEHDQPLGITYLQQDLSLYHAPHSFDVVVSNMVLMDIPEYQSAMLNCIEALKPGGQFIFSLSHPCFENSSAEYHEHGHIKITEYLNPYSIKQDVGQRWHRPLSDYLNLIAHNDCYITEVVEPQLDSSITPTRKDHHIPSYIIVAAQKNS